MYQKIKQLADEAIALQNKDRMDEVLRYISAICTNGNVMMVDGQYRTSVPPLPAISDAAITSATYGAGKAYATEGDMVADIQGVASSVIGAMPSGTGTAIAMSKQSTIGDALAARMKKGGTK